MVRASNYFRYGMRDTLRSLWRHKGMVFVSILTVAITLLILGATFLLSFNSQYIAKSMADQLEIVVFLKDNVSRDDALALRDDLKSVPGYKESTFVPKEEALDSMGSRFGEDAQLTDALGGSNPLPDAYHVRVETPEQINAAVSTLESNDKIEMVRYGQELVKNMMSLTDAITMTCIAIIVAMMVAALFLVNSTIRLTVFARSEEIAIMKYVGATNFYVRIPFFLEGLVIGIVGAIIATIALYFGNNAVVDYIVTNITFIPVITDHQRLWQIIVGMLLGGAALGALGSNIAVKKYLKV